eukprot:8171336-Karenia_brevis.AAC.1
MGTIYTDGSLLDARPHFEGHFARLGWAFVAVTPTGIITAAAHGGTPWWIDSIHGAELWALGCALSVTCDSMNTIWTDHKPLVGGVVRAQSWAYSPRKVFARAWSWIAAAMDDSKPAR